MANQLLRSLLFAGVTLGITLLPATLKAQPDSIPVRVQFPEPPPFGEESFEDTVKTAVMATFNGYKQAILQDKGTEAATYVSQRTFDYYQKVANLSRHADSLQVDSLPVMDKTMVLLLRARTPKQDLLSMDGRAIFIYAIEQGMVGKGSVANNDVYRVMYEADFARGDLKVRGEVVPLSLHFYRESQTWKLDLTSLFPTTAMAFDKLISDSGMTENEYLEAMIRSVAARPKNPIWKPLE